MIIIIILYISRSVHSIHSNTVEHFNTALMNAAFVALNGSCVLSQENNQLSWVLTGALVYLLHHHHHVLDHFPTAARDRVIYSAQNIYTMIHIL